MQIFSNLRHFIINSISMLQLTNDVPQINSENNFMHDISSSVLQYAIVKNFFLFSLFMLLFYYFISFVLFLNTNGLYKCNAKHINRVFFSFRLFLFTPIILFKIQFGYFHLNGKIIQKRIPFFFLFLFDMVKGLKK